MPKNFYHLWGGGVCHSPCPVDKKTPATLCGCQPGDYEAAFQHNMCPIEDAI